MSGATIAASELISNFGVDGSSLPHVIFSFAGAPEYPPYDGCASVIWQK